MDRQAMAYQEATRDPIFLFQFRRYTAPEQALEALHDDDRYAYVDDLGMCRAGTEEDEEPEVVPMNELVREGFFVEEWVTTSVWVSRQEAEAYGERRSYRFKNGWRVYCVCAEGELASMLERRIRETRRWRVRSIQTVNGHHISIERRSEERWLLKVDGHHVGLNRGDAEWLIRDLVAEVLSVDADALYSEVREGTEIQKP